MSDLLIRGMEMPKGGYRTVEIAFDADGHPMALADGGDVFDVIPVLPHGRLGDLDEMEKKYSQCLVGDAYGLMPTIIPASQPIDADFWGEEYAEAKGFDNASAEDSMT